LVTVAADNVYPGISESHNVRAAVTIDVAENAYVLLRPPSRLVAEVWDDRQWKWLARERE
jgi:hypothetical protein